MESTLIHLCNGFIKEEYFSLLDTVSRIDDRLLLVSLWSLTGGIALIALAFYFRARSVLLVAIVASLGFWVLQGSLTVQQAQYEPRMRQIEGTCYETARGPAITWGLAAADELNDAPDRSIADMPFSSRVAQTTSIVSPYLPVEIGPLGTAMADEAMALPHLLQIALALLGLLFMRRAKQPEPAPAPVVNVTNTPAPVTERPAPAKDTPAAPQGKPQAA